MGIKHKFVSTVPDDTDTSLVKPSNWNDDHDLEDGTILNSHIQSGASIDESKLNLNYSTHEHLNKSELDLVTDGDHDVRSDNPHTVTKAQIGLGDVPNLDTTDAVNNEHTHSNKAELDLITDGDHDVRNDNPHSVTKTQVGLGNVPDLDTTSAIANEHTHANKAQLDLVSDGDHDVRNDNPHSTNIGNLGSGNLAGLNLIITDATLDDINDSRPPSGTAGGDLEGYYPNPTIKSGSDSTAIHDNVANEINIITEKVSPIDTDILIIEDSGDSNNKKKIQLSNFPDKHTHTNKSELDLVSDGDHDIRTDNPHTVTKTQIGLSNVPNLDTTDAVNNEHTHSNKSELDLVTDGDHDIRTDNPHNTDIGNLNSGTLSELNSIITDANLDDVSSPRNPSGVAGGDLEGYFPNPTVKDGSDSTAIHTNIAGEINGISEKASPIGADIIVIEDSEDSNNKKKTQLSNFPSSHSHSNLAQLELITDGDHDVRTDNPHSVTNTQVGLGNVQNLDQTDPSNIVQDATHRFVTDTEKSTWNGKQDALGYTPENVANKRTAWSGGWYVSDSNSTCDWAGDTWLTDTSKSWTPNEWTGYNVRIGDPYDEVTITGNSATVLWFSGNTQTGLMPYEIGYTSGGSIDDNHYPTEKLVYDSLADKQDAFGDMSGIVKAVSGQAAETAVAGTDYEDISSLNANQARYWLWSHMMGVPNEMTDYFQGTGSDFSGEYSEETRPGIMSVETGTETAGRSGIYYEAYYALRPGTWEWTYETEIKLPVLADATDDYLVRVGFWRTNWVVNASATDIYNGACFEYDRTQSTTYWVLVTGVDSTYTRTVTSETVSADTWTKLKVVINSDCTSVAFYINDSLVGTHTTNLPDGKGISAGHGIHKVAGTTTRTMWIDWLNIRGNC